MRLVLLFLFSFAAHAANETSVTVRTETSYIIGERCDPEIVALTIFDHAGIVEANCKWQRIQSEPGPMLQSGGISVRFGKTHFESCRLVSTQRNHYDGFVYVAWAFNCRESP